MGVVYRARDERLQRDVAIKVLPPDAFGDEAARSRFQKEARALSRLNHPNIETVHEFDSQEGVDFLVMELIPGASLDVRLRAGALPEAEILSLGAQLSDGLEAAHEQGVVHRDIKPANLRVTPKGVLKILDFGLAKRLRAQTEETLSASLTAAGEVVGTVPYMSPEQLRGEALDARSDVYSAGTVLYEMAVGSRAFPHEPATRAIGAILHERPLAPRMAGAGISVDLERVILRCLAKEREGRYANAGALAEDLRRVAKGEGVSTPSAGATRPWHRLGWRALLASAATLVVLAAVLVFALDVGGLRGRILSGAGLRAASSEMPSLAVLPLTDISGDPSQEYFAEGMTDELITRLAQLPGLKVISRATAMRYKGTTKPIAEIARELDVKMLVQGTAQRAGDQVRIRAQLVEAATDRNLWADSFQSGTANVFAIQSEMARAIVDRIRIQITPNDRERLTRTGGVDVRAHDAYLRGRYEMNRLSGQEYRKAADFFLEATQIQPDYAEAWAGLAAAYYVMSSIFVDPAEGMPKARAAAARALEIRPDVAEAHAYLAAVLAHYDRKWGQAAGEAERAIQLEPSSSDAHFIYANILQSTGQLEKAQVEYDRACELDPLSNYGANYSIWCQYLRGRYDQAIARLSDHVQMDPRDAQAWYNLGQCYLEKGETARAIGVLQRADSLADGAWPLGKLGQAYAAAGRTADARATLERMKQAAAKSYLSPSLFALVYAGLGDRDRCFEWLEKAYVSHDEELDWIKVDPTFKNIRGDPRYSDLVRRLGLPL